MKKIILMICACGLLTIGCSDKKSSWNNTQYQATDVQHDIRTIDGHEYIVFAKTYALSVVHAESCPCKGNDIKIEAN